MFDDQKLRGVVAGRPFLFREQVEREREMMMRKAARKFSAAARHLLRKTIRKLNKKTREERPHSPSIPPSPSFSPSSAMASHVSPTLFPASASSVLPQPSTFFSPHLLSSPLPTNSFFQNFTLNNGDQPEYIHPYLVKSSLSSLSLSYPSRFVSPLFIYQAFSPDFTIAAAGGCGGGATHVISSFDDLSVTLDLPPSLSFLLVRGSPYITCSISTPTSISLSSIHAIISLSSNPNQTKHTISLNNGQTFLCYSSSPLFLSQPTTSSLSSQPFSGVIRVAHLPNPNSELLLDRFSSCYPISGKAIFSGPFSLEYRWKTKGWGELLLLAHPLHLKLLQPGGAAVLPELRYRSIDGDLVGVVADKWVLATSPLPITFHSISGVRDSGFPEIAAALKKDVGDLAAVAASSSYFFGKAVARAARLALIAEEIGLYEVIPAVKSFLEREITPWIDGSSTENGFVYDDLWGGIISKHGSNDAGADFGFGIYNDHHYHLGYFLYAMAVLSKLDPSWGRKYMKQGYAIAGDFMSFSAKRTKSSKYTRLRCFDLWKLHSWASGLTEFADGRNQESTSEAVNGYYSAALLGISYGDVELVAMASTLMALEIEAAITWWHVKEEDGIYEESFCRENRLVGVLWANKRDSGLWFGPPEWKECRLGIQVLPLLPVTEVLFRDLGFVREVVKWVYPALGREGVGEGWKGFVYALEGLVDVEGALEKTRGLGQFDDGNSLSNMLWWLYSRWVNC